MSNLGDTFHFHAEASSRIPVEEWGRDGSLAFAGARPPRHRMTPRSIEPGPSR